MCSTAARRRAGPTRGTSSPGLNGTAEPGPSQLRPFASSLLAPDPSFPAPRGEGDGDRVAEGKRPGAQPRCAWHRPTERPSGCRTASRKGVKPAGRRRKKTKRILRRSGSQPDSARSDPIGHQAESLTYVGPGRVGDLRSARRKGPRALRNRFSMAHRGGSLLADEFVVAGMCEVERADQLVVLVLGHGVGHRCAADRRRLEAPGAPAGVEVETLDGVVPMIGVKSGVMSDIPPTADSPSPRQEGNRSSRWPARPSTKSSVERRSAARTGPAMPP